MKREQVLLGGILVLFLAVNLLTAERSPTVWQDEVMFADPAASFLMGHGFTSAAWLAQPKEQLWIGNAPLHTVLLVPWMKIWGFGPRSVRSVNYLYIGIAAVLLWAWLRRRQLINRPELRVLCVAAVLCGQGVAFIYRSGRYDNIGILLVTAALFASTASSLGLRQSVLVLLGLLMPLAALQLMPFLALWGILLAVLFGMRVVGSFIPVAIGCAIGGALLNLAALAFGVWRGLFDLVRVYGYVGLPESRSLCGWLARKCWDVVLAFRGDLSLIGVILILVIAASIALASRRFTLRSPEAFGLVGAVVVPLGVSLGGHFVSYYSWMVFIPGLICCFMILERWPDSVKAGGSRTERIPSAVCATLLATAAAVGLPLRLARTFAEWRDRDYAPVERFVSAGLRPEDHVYADFAAYYPAKRTAEVVFLPPYRRMMRPEEKAGVTVLVVAPSEAGDAQEFMGGAWSEVARWGHGRVVTVVDRLQLAIFGQATAMYDLATYRRQEGRTNSP